MKKSVLRKYAELIARVGVNVQPRQSVRIRAGLDQPEFVAMLAEECYRAGAAEVTVDWSYQPLVKLGVKWQADETLGAVKNWEELRERYRAETLPADILLMSDDPDGLQGMDQAKWALGTQSRRRKLKPITDLMENKQQWCIAAVPGIKWAKKMFPDKPRGKAVEKLWEAILSAARVTDYPVDAWYKHNLDLQQRCDYLNSLGLASLEYKADNGTDLRVGLMPECIFCGGRETTLESGIDFNPNIPSEEVFTTPRRGAAEGIVYSSKPLAFRGVMIEDFSVRFEGGKAVEVHAAKNEEALKGLIAMDEGAAFLGECALVPEDSPISRSGLMFYNTLFDENAACHLALGMGFSNCVRGYEDLSLEQCRELGVNDSIVHEDFMIGTPDLSIVGVTNDGKRIMIFENGNWAF